MPRPSLVSSLVLAMLLVCGCHRGEASTAASLTLVDLDGRRVDPLRLDDVAVRVFLFTRTDCPISNRYAPEVRRLHEKFASRGVGFWLVYPNPDVTADAIREHLEAYGYECSALRDPEHALVRRTEATVTPEAAVFDARGVLAYRGRIDDRYVDLGQSRAAASRHDLEHAIDALLSKRRVEPARTQAVGCLIVDLQ